jgi:hypothetical protein
VFVLRRARPVLTFLPIISGYSLLYLIKSSDDIQKIREFQSSHLYGNFICPDLAHAVGDKLITRCMRESVETLSNTSKSSTDALQQQRTIY